MILWGWKWRHVAVFIPRGQNRPRCVDMPRNCEGLAGAGEISGEGVLRQCHSIGKHDQLIPLNFLAISQQTERRNIFVSYFVPGSRTFWPQPDVRSDNLSECGDVSKFTESSRRGRQLSRGHEAACSREGLKHLEVAAYGHVASTRP